MRRSTAVRLLRPWVRIPPEAWMLVVCCVLSGRGLCDGLITRPEESYRLWCVVVCDLETSWMGRPRPTGGLSRHEEKIIINIQSDDVIKDEIYSWRIPLKKHTYHLNTGRSNCVKPGEKNILANYRVLLIICGVLWGRGNMFIPQAAETEI